MTRQTRYSPEVRTRALRMVIERRGEHASKWTAISSIAAKIGDRTTILGIIKGILSGQVYAFYTWLLWPVLFRSSIRQISGRGSWAKTSREAIDPPVS